MTTAPMPVTVLGAGTTSSPAAPGRKAHGDLFSHPAGNPRRPTTTASGATVPSDRGRADHGRPDHSCPGRAAARRSARRRNTAAPWSSDRT